MSTTIRPAAIRSVGNALGMELWLVTLDEAGEPGTALLSSAERARAERFAFDSDRRRYIAAHLALRQLLAMRTGEALSQLRFEDGAYGKPRLCDDRCTFSLSHSAQYALIAIGDTDDIGTDIEIVRTMPDADRLAERLYTPAEQTELAAAEDATRAFLRCWTRKEACLKAVGRGLSIEPSTFEVGTMPEQRMVPIPIDGSAVVVTVTSVQAGTDCVAAVARTESRDPSHQKDPTGRLRSA